MSPSKFPTDELKSYYLIDRLKGPAQDWVYPVIMADQTIIADYEHFSAALLKNFQGPDKKPVRYDAAFELASR